MVRFGNTYANFLDGTIVPVIGALNPGVAISGELCSNYTAAKIVIIK